MRVLFTTMAQLGHFHPLVPIARAVAEAGHEVAFACAPAFQPTVEAAGFRALPAGFDRRGRAQDTLFPGRRQHAGPGIAYWAIPHVIIGVYAATMVPDLLTICQEWPPDLIVRDSLEFGGCVAAETLGLPHASVRTDSASATFALRHHWAAALAPLRERSGLPPDPDNTMLFRYLHLACEPPRFVPAGAAPAPTAHLLRPENFESGDEPLPPWVAGLPTRPTVYATLGTGISAEAAGRAPFAAILAALRDEPYNLILTVGRTNDPDQFGAQPPNVRIARYIPQSRLLPHCDLVVNQGGFSTVTGALNAGLPLVVIPLSADQPLNAACCAALGAGRVIEPGEQTAEGIRAAVRAVLADPAYRTNAERVRDEMAALPGPEYAVTLLERLGRDKQPILSA